jgi:hypothetical protein
MTEFVDSTSEQRVVNNSMRQKYRVLSDAEKAHVDRIKSLGSDFTNLLHEIGGTDPTGERFGSRNLSIAFTAIEDAVMRAVKHVTA